MIDWPSIFIQIPIVAVFIWYSRDLNKQFTQALERRDALYEARNNALVESIKAETSAIAANTQATIQLCQAMTTHDTWTHEAVVLMVENSRGKHRLDRNDNDIRSTVRE